MATRRTRCGGAPVPRRASAVSHGVAGDSLRRAPLREIDRIPHRRASMRVGRQRGDHVDGRNARGRGFMSRRIWFAAAVAVIALSGVALAPASAADPGVANGRIAFGTRANGGFNIDTVMPDGSDLKAVTSGAGFHLCPDYTPDGRQIVFCANTSGAFELWTIKQNGGKPTQLTHFGGFAIFPDGSPDSSKIAFHGWVNEPGNDQVV